MSTHMERIQALDSIEKEIITCIQSAGQALQELSKDKSNLKQAETQTNQFLKTLNHVESRLNEQINYLTQVSTGQPHEGSGYAAGKALQMAWHRFEHIRVRIKELDNFKSNQMQVWTIEANKRNAAAAVQNSAMPPMQPQQLPQQGVENVNQQS